MSFQPLPDRESLNDVSVSPQSSKLAANRALKRRMLTASAVTGGIIGVFIAIVVVVARADS